MNVRNMTMMIVSMAIAVVIVTGVLVPVIADSLNDSEDVWPVYIETETISDRTMESLTSQFPNGEGIAIITTLGFEQDFNYRVIIYDETGWHGYSRGVPLHSIEPVEFTVTDFTIEGMESDNPRAYIEATIEVNGESQTFMDLISVVAYSYKGLEGNTEGVSLTTDYLDLTVPWTLNDGNVAGIVVMPPAYGPEDTSGPKTEYSSWYGSIPVEGEITLYGVDFEYEYDDAWRMVFGETTETTYDLHSSGIYSDGSYVYDGSGNAPFYPITIPVQANGSGGSSMPSSIATVLPVIPLVVVISIIMAGIGVIRMKE